MSSNDRYTRPNRQRQARVPAETNPEDDIVSEDQWDVDPDADDVLPARQRIRTNAARPQTSQPRATLGPPELSGTPGAPSVDGTAAQINRLRSNIRQSARPTTRTAPVQGTRQPSPRSSQRKPLREDQIVTDTAFSDDETYRPSSQSQPTPVQRRSSTNPARRSRAGYDEAPYVDDPYVDYDEYDDDFSDYDAPRRPDRRARPRPQFTMPNISRPSLPPSIARADLVNDAPALGIIGVGLASLAAMAIFVANQAESLAPQFATHVSASGMLENFKDDSALWNLPLMAAMFTLMNIVMAWFISPLDRFASRFVLVGALVAQVLTWVAIIRIL